MQTNRAILITAAIGLAVWICVFLFWNPWSKSKAKPDESKSATTTQTTQTPPLLDPADVWKEVDQMDDVSNAGATSPAGATTAGTGNLAGTGTAPTDANRMNLRVGGNPPATASGPTSAARPPATTTGPATTARPSATPATAAPAATTSPAKAARVHTIKKGDTLSSIAKSYLGSSAQWRRIYDANRDVLKNPNQLPVGAKLNIPEDTPTTSQRPAGASTPAGVRLAADTPVRGLETMETVTPVPDPATSAPATQGTSNVPVATVLDLGAPARAADAATTDTVASGDKKTYVIGRGDTLASISQRFYGKEHAWQKILDANKDTIKNPKALRPGTKITIP